MESISREQKSNSLTSIKPARGDVFVFVPPHERNKNFIKRIVAVGGDTIETKADTLYVNGAAIEDSNYTKHVSHAIGHRYDFPPFRKPYHLPNDKVFAPYKLSPNQFHMTFPEGRPFEVPEGYVFAMGDNRDQSSDSRTWGPVSVNDIKGKPSWSIGLTTHSIRKDLGKFGRLSMVFDLPELGV